MRAIMTELERKVPRDEWKHRMKRKLTQIELLQRENLRLRQELAQAPGLAAAAAWPTARRSWSWDPPSSSPRTRRRSWLRVAL